ncbi:MAG: CPBP family intramembrane glutamic endopeptidase, partial [Kiritimatiellia bacterium]
GFIPAALIWLQLHGGFPFFGILIAFMVLTLGITVLDPRVRFRFDPSDSPVRSLLQKVFLRLLLSAGVLTLLTVCVYPDLFLQLPRERPRIWLMVMCLYPLLSVAPQEFIFRGFFMQRYQPLFGEGRTMLWVNALVFGWTHVFFLNAVAPLLSIIAGYLLASTWRQSKSFWLVCLEHAVYGQIVFTTGLGWFFYNGTARAIVDSLH